MTTQRKPRDQAHHVPGTELDGLVYGDGCRKYPFHCKDCPFPDCIASALDIKHHMEAKRRALNGTG